MTVQAPFQYVSDYYASVQRKNARFPDVARFWLSALGQIDADSVLNAGCGPMFYDNLLHFARSPRVYVGLDLNASSFEFLNHSTDPDLLAAKARAEASGGRIELVCEDMLACGERFEGRFDAIVGVGFFATFHGAGLDRLLAVSHKMLKPGGRLLKLTWHAPHRSAAQTADKLRYRYDSAEEPSPEDLVAAFEDAGFRLANQSTLECDPAEIGFEAIQACLFQRGQ